MNTAEALDLQEKKEQQAEKENTQPGRTYTPNTDIFETEEALTVLMEMPGVEKKDINIQLEQSTLTVEGRVEVERYQPYQPAYTEYNIGHYSRSFRLANSIDQSNISAKMEDGVLSLTLPKAKESSPSKIHVH